MAELIPYCNRCNKKLGPKDWNPCNKCAQKEIDMGLANSIVVRYTDVFRRLAKWEKEQERVAEG